jgi:hypothetical protein
LDNLDAFWYSTVSWKYVHPLNSEVWLSYEKSGFVKNVCHHFGQIAPVSSFVDAPSLIACRAEKKYFVPS